MDSHPSSHNLAARMARWSSKHRKKAFWGWLAFVILAFAIGNMVGSNQISDVDNFNGESHRAEQALDRAGLRPQSEVVFVQSDTLTTKDPQFRAAVNDVTTHLRKVAYVKHVKSPLRGESAVSEDGHAALVDFDVAGDSIEAGDRIDPVLAAVAAAQTPAPAGDQVAGKALWDGNTTSCKNCHGLKGEGGYGPDLAGRKLTFAQFNHAVMKPWGVMPKRCWGARPATSWRSSR